MRGPSDEGSPVDSVTAVNSSCSQAHPHWCTVCENPAPIKTCDGWKRHEKEQHEVGFVCMPDGPIVETGTGRRCAFCGLVNPDQKHLELHGTVLCADRSMRDRRFTRRFQLVRHLKTHGIFNNIDLADSWRVTLKNKYYSCGFCVSLFRCIGERLNHIDSLHFRRYQSISEWNLNKVIRGLLLQPAVLASWREHSVYDIRSANLVWEPHVIALLQTRLQISEEPPARLAMDAFRQSSLKPDPPSVPIFGARSPQVTTPQATQLVHGQVAVTQDDRSEMTFQSDMAYQAPLMQWNAMAVEPTEVSPTELHPPRVLNENSFEVPVTKFAYSNSALPSSMSNPSHAYPLHANPTLNEPYITPVYNSVNRPYYEDQSQRSESTLNSWYSSSLASTNTSVHSLPSCLSYDRCIPHAAGVCGPPIAHQIIAAPIRTHTNFPECRKSPSMIAQLKRKFSRVKLRGMSTGPEVLMDIDVDDMMRIMEEDQQTRSHVDTRHEVSFPYDSMGPNIESPTDHPIRRDTRQNYELSP